jgi:Ca2+-binding EF-hand superfamily protein
MKRFVIIAAGATTAAALAASAGEMPSFGDIDTDASGAITEAEFVAYKTADGEKTAEEARDVFAMIDTNMDGQVSKVEMEMAMEEWKDEKSDVETDTDDESDDGMSDTTY